MQFRKQTVEGFARNPYVERVAQSDRNGLRYIVTGIFYNPSKAREYTLIVYSEPSMESAPIVHALGFRTLREAIQGAHEHEAKAQRRERERNRAAHRQRVGSQVPPEGSRYDDSPDDSHECTMRGPLCMTHGHDHD